MLTVGTLGRISGILPLTRRLTYTSSVVVFLSFAIMFASVVHDAIHGIVSLPIRHVIVVEPEARSAAGASALSFVVSGQCVSTSKSTSALGAGMRAFSRVKFCVAFQIVQTPETSLAGRTFIWLFLTVRQEMTFQVMVSREVSSNTDTCGAWPTATWDCSDSRASSSAAPERVGHALAVTGLGK